MERKLAVVSMHFTTDCNMRCPFCYRPSEAPASVKPRSFFIECVKYIGQLAPQIALGGGEPFLFPGFIGTLGEECKKRGVILNVTTNGTLIRDMDSASLHQAIKDVTMVSVSLDHAKYRDLRVYAFVIHRLRSAKPSILVGTNLLLEPGYFEERGKPMFMIVDWLARVARVDRVYLLHPKIVPLGVDILQFKDLLSAISTVFPGKIFCDDLTRQILDHGCPPWPVPCHHGKDIVSIDEQGGIHGCSFDTEPVLKLATPSDVLKIKDIAFENRMTCPYLKR